MKKPFLSPQSLKKIVRLSSIVFTLGTLSYSNVSYADVEGIPDNRDFPNAQYPYAQAPDGCSGWQNTRQVRDTWGPVKFTEACNNHDRCYYTRGSNWNTCNERFYSDLRTACERDLRTSTRVPAPTLREPGRTRRVDLPPDPARLSACYTVASGYYAGVQAGVLVNVFNEAQGKQRRYEEWVASVRNPTSLASSPVFDADFYLMSYGDLRNAFGTNQGAAKNHWLTHGIKEGRRSSPAFDVQYYLSLYPDLQNAFSSDYVAAINHWLTHGIKEGRRSSIVFDVQYYLNNYPDLQNAFGAQNYVAAINHWLTHGVSEGRRGSPDFDPKFYLSNNPDVAKVYGANNYKGAIEHYLEFGRGEGRRGTP